MILNPIHIKSILVYRSKQWRSNNQKQTKKEYGNLKLTKEDPIAVVKIRSFKDRWEDRIIIGESHLLLRNLIRILPARTFLHCSLTNPSPFSTVSFGFSGLLLMLFFWDVFIKAPSFLKSFSFNLLRLV